MSKCQVLTRDGTFCNKEAKHDLDGLMVCDLHADLVSDHAGDLWNQEQEIEQGEMERRAHSRGLRPTVKGGTLAREAHEDSIEQEPEQDQRET